MPLDRARVRGPRRRADHASCSAAAAQLAPLVFEAFDWNHGVFLGATMAPRDRRGATGKVGVVRRDPMAMLPFCGYNMGDYFAPLAGDGQPRADAAARVFHVNWFRKDRDGKFLWPGFGENVRVLEWIVRSAGATRRPRDTDRLRAERAQPGAAGARSVAGRIAQLLAIDPTRGSTRPRATGDFLARFGDRLRWSSRTSTARSSPGSRKGSIDCDGSTA